MSDFDFTANEKALIAHLAKLNKTRVGIREELRKVETEVARTVNQLEASGATVSIAMDGSFNYVVSKVARVTAVLSAKDGE